MHPSGSLREQGYDRVAFTDGGIADLAMGQGVLLSRAVEDAIMRGVWLQSVHGARMFVVLSKVDVITEWRPESMHSCEVDQMFYEQDDL